MRRAFSGCICICVVDNSGGRSWLKHLAPAKLVRFGSMLPDLEAHASAPPTGRDFLKEDVRRSSMSCSVACSVGSVSSSHVSPSEVPRVAALLHGETASSLKDILYSAMREAIDRSSAELGEHMRDNNARVVARIEELFADQKVFLEQKGFVRTEPEVPQKKSHGSLKVTVTTQDPKLHQLQPSDESAEERSTLESARGKQRCATDTGLHSLRRRKPSAEVCSPPVPAIRIPDVSPAEAPGDDVDTSSDGQEAFKDTVIKSMLMYPSTTAERGDDVPVQREGTIAESDASEESGPSIFSVPSLQHRVRSGPTPRAVGSSRRRSSERFAPSQAASRNSNSSLFAGSASSNVDVYKLDEIRINSLLDFGDAQSSPSPGAQRKHQVGFNLFRDRGSDCQSNVNKSTSAHIASRLRARFSQVVPGAEAEEKAVEREADEVSEVTRIGSAPNFPPFTSSCSNSPKKRASLFSSAHGSEIVRDFESARNYNMDTLRVNVEREMLRNSTVVDIEHTPSAWSFWDAVISAPQILICFAGIIPFRQGRAFWLLSNFAPALQLACLVYSVHQAIVDPTVMYVHLSTACLASGSLLSVAVMRRYHIRDLLGPDKVPLEVYAEKNSFFCDWQDISMIRFVWVLGVWLFFIAQAVVLPNLPGYEHCIPRDVGTVFIGVPAFVMVFGFFSISFYCVLHVCCCLELMVDTYCLNFFRGEVAIPDHVSEWNILQAILRRAADTIDTAFLILQTTILACLLLSGMEAFAVKGCALVFGPSGALTALLGLYTLFRAAAVSEKCSRVAPLVNSLTFDREPIDYERMYMVQYIMNSAAGFYVKGVRLSMQIVLKLVYGLGAVVFTMVARVMMGH